LAASQSAASKSEARARGAERLARAQRYAELGRRRFGKGDWNGAKEHLAQALRLGDKDPDLPALLAQARSKARLAGEKKPAPAGATTDSAKVRETYLRGIYAYAAGDTLRAVEAWKEVLKLEPGHLQARDAMDEANRKLAALERLKKRS
jgi:tetratricopeptide (TPR) repeat protein